MIDSQLFVNRELSWLEFNQRVLDEAADPAVPLLERLRFLAITASNLDEFFMVRVGSLRTAIRRNDTGVDPSGMSAVEQLEAVSERVHAMVRHMYHIFLDQVEPELTRIGIKRRHVTELTQQQQDFVEQLFEEVISAVLTPIAVHDPERFPLLMGRTINVAVQLAPANPAGEDAADSYRYAIIPLGRSDLRFITIPSEGGHEFVLGEDVIALLVQRFFPGETIVSTVPFRITRNADLTVREDDGADLLAEMEDVLEERKDSFCVRLEISDHVTVAMLAFLKNLLRIKNRDVYVLPGPAGFGDLTRLADLPGHEQHLYPTWTACAPVGFEPGVSIFETIREKDRLLYHPYESFQPVVRLVEEAAADPDVLAIKQTLYRTSRNSPIVEALITAAEKGKNVTAIVELKARFDEARNIEWAKQLELAGVQVIYGVRGLKTHAKACMIVRREPDGFRRYCHFGTGNYNEVTAGLYTDLSYMTCNEDLGNDAVAWFNAVTGYSQLQQFEHISSAPIGLRERLLELIQFETDRCRNNAEGMITAKVNSLVDPRLIQALYKASQAGVKIRLNVRGICCLKPGVPGLSDNIEVISIIDRFLEHARVFHFLHGGNDQVLMSSADLMPRNLDRRIELLVPILDDDCQQKAISMLKNCLRDNVKARRITATGGYKPPAPDSVPAHRSQTAAQKLAKETEENAFEAKRRMFVPQTPN
ncbi:MAG: polyphosphate kinase 1 [Planctomycetaceae bacterium]